MAKEHRIDILRKMFKEEIYGHQNIMTQDQINSKLGCDERVCRGLIQRLRVAEDMPIISLSKDKIVGSFLMNPADPTDRKYARHYVRETKHRAHETSRGCKSVEKRLTNDEIIPSLFDQVNNGPEAA